LGMGFSTTAINIKNEPVTISQNRDNIKACLKEDKIKIIMAQTIAGK